MISPASRPTFRPILMRGRGRPKKIKPIPETLPDFDRIVRPYAKPGVRRSQNPQSLITQNCGAQAMYHDTHRTYLVFYAPDLTPSLLLQQHGTAFKYVLYNCLPRIKIVCLHVGVMSNKSKNADDCELVFGKNHNVPASVIVVTL